LTPARMAAGFLSLRFWGLLACRLAASQGDILEDTALVENLEETKRTALEIANKVVQAKASVGW